MQRPYCGTPELPNFSNTNISEDLIKTMLDPNISYIQRKRTQQLIELTLVQQGTCQSLNPGIVEDLRYKIFNIDDVNLQNALNSNESFNANLQADISCLIDAVIYDDGTVLTRDKLHNWLKGIKQIGTKSIDAIALSASFSEDTNLFVIKAPGEKNPFNDIIHEVFVGFYALNRIRAKVPNFMYVYGFTKCNKPVLNQREVLSWCTSGTNFQTYMITENITNSQPIETIIQNNITGEEFLAIMLQIFNALNIAYKNFGFTHYDLHTNNILVKVYKEPVSIPFYGGVSDEILGYVYTRYVPYIIDYGLSSITVNGINFGVLGGEKYNITPGPFPMYDIYKILGFIAEALIISRKVNPDILDITNRLFQFFNEGSVIDRVNNRYNFNNGSFYIAPIKYKNITHDDYINWLLTQSGIMLPIYNDIVNDVFNAPYDTCKFSDNFLQNGDPKTPIEYCDIITTIKNNQHIPPEVKFLLIHTANNNYDSERYFAETLPNVIQTIRIATQSLQESSIPPINTIDILSYEEFNRYQDKILVLLYVKGLIDNLDAYYKYNLCALQEQGKFKREDQRIINLHNSIEFIRNEYRRNLATIKNNKDILVEYVREGKNSIEDPVLRKNWYGNIPSYISSM